MAHSASLPRVDPRFLQNEGTAIFTGNELLVKGALETEGGVHLLTGYPGSPIASFFDTLESIGPLLDAHGVCGKMASNEALSMAMVNGAQMAGCRAITAMKSVGVHVASDALALGVLAGTQTVGGSESGGLVILGDDPWSDSTQVPADSRFIAEHVRLPVLEPGTPQEVKDYVDLAFQLGRAGQIYIGYLLTVLMADGGGTVTCRPNHYPAVNQHQKKTLSYLEDIEPKLEDTVLLPPRTGRREEQLPQRLQAVVDKARELGINRIVNGPRKDERAPLGFVAAGNAYTMLTHALGEMKLLGKLPILKMSLVYPVDTQLVEQLARQCDQLIVIEERRSFVERQVLEAVQSMRRRGEPTAEIYGKELPQVGGHTLAGIPAARGLNPSLLIQRLTPLLRHHPTLSIELTNGNLTSLLERVESTANVHIDLPTRTPTFCPGCPHRDSSSVLLELRKDL
ncbi:MAG: indolepyruvate ferredoxin oxidoreductase, partial [Phycisphaeraceae bacterium]